jgi:hypothetical protein
MTEPQLLLLSLLGLLLPVLYYWDGGPVRPAPAPAPRLVVLVLSRLQVNTRVMRQFSCLIRTHFLFDATSFLTICLSD